MLTLGNYSAISLLLWVLNRPGDYHPIPIRGDGEEEEGFITVFFMLLLLTIMV